MMVKILFLMIVNLLFGQPPLTIPANLAVAVHPDYEYVVLAVEERYLVVAKELVSSFSQAIGWRL